MRGDKVHSVPVPRKRRVYLFDVDQLCDEDVFSLLADFINPSSMIHGAVMYFYHHESYFLDELTASFTMEKFTDLGYDDEDAEDFLRVVDESFGVWLDSFYAGFSPQFESLMKERQFVFEDAEYSKRNNEIRLRFKRRLPHEHFHPAY